MKIAAIIIGIFGLVHLMYLPKAFHLADNPKWLLDVWISISGILLLFLSAGIWTRRIFAWYLGFVYIVLLPLGFLARVCLRLPAVSTGEKAIIVSACSVFVILFVVYWSVVWYRQKKWFSNERVA
ncbi:MAG: hypothetical protein ABSE97_01240 [Verrucomicrobiota bacterium]|jgi:hypothetical protein